MERSICRSQARDTGMKPMPEGPHKDDPVQLGGGRSERSVIEVARLIGDLGQAAVAALGDLSNAVIDLPFGVYEGANRYDTDDEHVLHLWRGGQSWDIRLPRAKPETPA